MYCSSCNSYNDDSSRFCSNCGAPLQKQQAEQPDAGSWQAPPQGDYAPQQSDYAPPQNAYTYQQPYQPTYQAPAGEPTKPLTMTTPVVSIILNVVFFNIIGLIFAVLSLINFNNYSSEKLRGAIELAETYKRKSRTYSKVAIVFAVLTFLFCIGIVVAAVVFGVLSLSSGGAPEFNFDSSAFPQDFFGMIG